MRLQCEVEVLSRLLPSCGLRGRGRATRALLSLGRPPGGAGGGSVYLMVCTARDRAGARYKVQENVERCFTRFVEEGKATLRLREPAVDICLSKVGAGRARTLLGQKGQHRVPSPENKRHGGTMIWKYFVWE
uniref:PIF1/LRR1 pleckstrin homology domain-containing protein n=1 Tax=Cairina moschata TaxID=8855 RepID=A0A8C3C239_CAIMO